MQKYLKISLLLLFVSLCWAFTSSQDCKLLPNGVYLVTYTSPNAPKDTKLVIDNGCFSQYDNNGDSASGKIRWLNDCSFIFEYSIEEKQDTSRLNNLLRKSFGESCTKLKAIAPDTIAFRTTYTGNVHITINEGKYIKIK